MSALRNVLASAVMIAVLGAGYGMWAIISPDESRRREMLRDLPEADPHRMDESRRRTALVMQALKEASETNENIARSR
ncbi:ubiquinol-cytochrome-c reductase complex assembly factor 3 [Boleophthalmus pectinirostris]|uniref:ubiquinol-cytochrome-c reductase complex assembly factor 3 n=1 Tax=Boleophthalmus pectinirostris TaxID=150288 RepID=UPI000A1C28DB|nr:ubiquinol-cytochrome-c reductase complex assembly factor 3 [Boleophthalmus pectinirostris]